jgi:hypothetical protein
MEILKTCQSNSKSWYVCVWYFNQELSFFKDIHPLNEDVFGVFLARLKLSDGTNYYGGIEITWKKRYWLSFS